MTNSNTNTTFTFASATTSVFNHIATTVEAGNSASGNSAFSLGKVVWNTVKLAPLVINMTARTADYVHGLSLKTNVGTTLNNTSMLNTFSKDAITNLGTAIKTDTINAYEKVSSYMDNNDAVTPEAKAKADADAEALFADVKLDNK